MRILTLWFLALALSWAAPSNAGTLSGTVRVGSPPAMTSRGNAYPGRASSLPAGGAVHHGQIGDAVVYLDRYPAGAESTFVSSARERPSLAQKDQSFVPRVLAVAVGTRVDFPNLDRIYHNVFSLSPVRRFDLGKYPRGESRQVAFTKPGLVNVYCDIHADMEAFVLVLPHVGFVRPEANGSFVFPKLRAGHYRVKIWHPDFPEQSRELDVPATGGVTCDFDL
jgi:plastocyanin